MPPKKSTEIELRELIDRVNQLEEVLAEVGIELGWMSPDKAAKLLSISRNTVMREVDAAEEKRYLNRKTDLIYGKHYRKVASHWQIHYQRFKKVVMDTPPEQRL